MTNEDINLLFPDERSTKKTNVKRCHSALLRIMKYIHYVCERENIAYWICGGTLLGAVIHKGFKPLSYDMDICLDRKEYFRLYDALRKDLLDGVDIGLYDHACLLMEGESREELDTSGFFRVFDTLARYTKGEFSGSGIGVDVHCVEINKGLFNLRYKGFINGFEAIVFRKSILYPLRKYSFEDYEFEGPANAIRFLEYFSYSSKQGYSDYIAHIDYYTNLRLRYDNDEELNEVDFMVSGL